ncbi:MAG: hypothetical protein K2M73_09965 [Lachnospiraceae bacterium]|nr:hypothetical protein [Lachnospiraceae bacterium]
MDFRNDDWEGRLSIKNDYRMIMKENIIEMTSEQLGILQDIVVTDEKINEFIKSVHACVSYFSKNPYSDYIKNKFISDATNGEPTGENIILVFNAEKLKEDMYIVTSNNDNRHCINNERDFLQYY